MENFFGDLLVSHLKLYESDHRPILFDTSPTQSTGIGSVRGSCHFHFEECRANLDSCNELIKSSWNRRCDQQTMQGLVSDIQDCTDHLLIWDPGRRFDEMKKILMSYLIKRKPTGIREEVTKVVFDMFPTKVVANALANRFQTVLDVVILETHSAFIPGRLTSDNSIVGYECMHALHTCKKGLKGVMAPKLDISKAHDRLEWEFLVGMMKRLGFSEAWIR
ncbi:hypothetical protein Dsin_015986 [Dipteronia sinensis]|uniref:Reverse transcriptase n=1 Tax=Dipteronia sinensis TaxID=43782 RepID=A0AAE0E5J5_9ROSI|nr:hypothetical protein Dsin_015986 [Dipteronia sinensis]